MARLPVNGGDDGQWGQILNDFLLTGHNPDGSLKLEQVQDSLNSKAPITHTHPASDISGLQSMIDTAVQQANGQLANRQLLAAYSFNSDFSTSTIKDTTGNGFHFTAHIDTEWTSAGHTGGALESLGNAGDYNGGASVTSMYLPQYGVSISGWVYPTAQENGERLLFGFGGGRLGDSQFTVWQNRGTQPNLLVLTRVNGTLFWLTYASGLPLNEWTHVTATHDGYLTRLYLNGELVQSLNCEGNTNLVGGFEVGANAKARIDDVRVHKTALEPDEVVQLINTPVV